MPPGLAARAGARENAGHGAAETAKSYHAAATPDRTMNGSRALGIDFGERRIGLALSDADGRLALPWKVIERRSDDEAVAAIARIVAEEEISRLVVGEPRRIGGAPESETFRRAHGFGAKLERATGLEIEWVDEAFTSADAAARLREVGIDSRRARGRLDAVAAQLLLQDALDRRSRADGGGS